MAEPFLNELASQYALSLSDYRAVRMLGRLGAMPVSRFGAELGIPRSTITNLVDRLEKAGLVERAPDPLDRRVTLVRLTSAGNQAVEAGALWHDSEMVRRLRALDPDSQTVLASLLERVVDAAPADAPNSDSPDAGIPEVDARSEEPVLNITKGLQPVS